MLIDSSKNGYGLVVSTTLPITYNPDNGFIIAYRQWQGLGASSGYIGAAYSADGESWDIFSNLNVDSPAEIKGRYPSAIGSMQFPYVFWNEYTSGSGGGTYGGRALYTYDLFEWGGGWFYSPPIDVNATVPEPPDMWAGSPDYSTDGTEEYFNVVYSSWTNRNKYLYHSELVADGIIVFAQANKIFDVENYFAGDPSTNYTSETALDINDNGIGYAVVSTYWKDGLSFDVPTSHTLVLRKTTDYGATWSEGGSGESPYFYVSDSVLQEQIIDAGLLPEYYVDKETGDTTWFEGTFVGYDMDVKVDNNGNPHIIVAVIPTAGSYVYPSIDPGCGFYHFTTTDVTDPESWEISFVGTTQITFMFSHGSSSNWQRIFPNLSISADNQSRMYVIYNLLSDTSAALINYDVISRFSDDGGVTWSPEYNLTNTIELEVDEIDPHIAKYSNDSLFYFIFQVPDYSTSTVQPPEVPEDYKNRVYFATATFEPVGINNQATLPDKFVLNQNYPNPFNPITKIEYTLFRSATVRLSVFDITGREIAVLENGWKSRGNHTVRFNGNKFSSGIYFYRLEAGDMVLTGKMVLLK
jgi:hypothetical protein